MAWARTGCFSDILPPVRCTCSRFSTSYLNSPFAGVNLSTTLDIAEPRPEKEESISRRLWLDDLIPIMGAVQKTLGPLEIGY